MRSFSAWLSRSLVEVTSVWIILFSLCGLGDGAIVEGNVTRAGSRVLTVITYHIENALLTVDSTVKIGYKIQINGPSAEDEINDLSLQLNNMPGHRFICTENQMNAKISLENRKMSHEQGTMELEQKLFTSQTEGGKGTIHWSNEAEPQGNTNGAAIKVLDHKEEQADAAELATRDANNKKKWRDEKFELIENDFHDCMQLVDQAETDIINKFACVEKKQQEQMDDFRKRTLAEVNAHLYVADMIKKNIIKFDGQQTRLHCASCTSTCTSLLWGTCVKDVVSDNIFRIQAGNAIDLHLFEDIKMRDPAETSSSMIKKHKMKVDTRVYGSVYQQNSGMGGIGSMFSGLGGIGSITAPQIIVEDSNFMGMSMPVAEGCYTYS